MLPGARHPASPPSIRLELQKKRVRLADVLDRTATLSEPLELADDTIASLVIVADEIETRTGIIVFRGSYLSGQIIRFDYLPDHFIWFE